MPEVSCLTGRFLKLASWRLGIFLGQNGTGRRLYVILRDPGIKELLFLGVAAVSDGIQSRFNSIANICSLLQPTSQVVELEYKGQSDEPIG